MSCCTHRCNQGRHCTARRRLVNITRALTGYAIVLAGLMSAAAAVAMWIALPASGGL